ncbi:hypothetical protein PIB30_015709 [Stylosanthes scabra]|uniref:Uncharacterized protein n=1 Tax=Stylosanthes scabra TaxID=79078 RepID=A0ABU6WAL6_9FABA|nr:hypothetical protein [Stylosanthes scabra]
MVERRWTAKAGRSRRVSGRRQGEQTAKAGHTDGESRAHRRRRQQPPRRRRTATASSRGSVVLRWRLGFPIHHHIWGEKRGRLASFPKTGRVLVRSNRPVLQRLPHFRFLLLNRAAYAIGSLSDRFDRPIRSGFQNLGTNRNL